MPDRISLQEFIAQSQRGAMGRVFGPEFIQKQTYLQVSNIFTETYGRKVWEALNNRTVFWNAIKKVGWGPTTGWRLRTDRGSDRSRPVTEVGSLPTIDVSNYVNVSSLPRIAATDFGVSIKAMFTGQLEGGIGDALAVEREAASRDHLKELNQELLLKSACLASAAGSTTTFKCPTASRFYRVGDTVAFYDISEADYEETQGGVISDISSDGTTDTVTVSTLAQATADGDVIYIKARAGMTSLDDIVAEDDMTVGGQKAAPDVYNLTTRTAGTYAAGAYVNHNSGVGRDLTLALIDTCIQKCRENGGEPKLILTGHDQYFKLNQLLQAQQRFLGTGELIVGVGDERTYPGTATGLAVATYMGIPILPDADVPKSVATDDSALGSNLYVLDTDFFEIAVAQPTQYIENRDFFAANALVVRGLLYTMAELRCRNIWVQSKLGDLNS